MEKSIPSLNSKTPKEKHAKHRKQMNLLSTKHRIWCLYGVMMDSASFFRNSDANSHSSVGIRASTCQPRQTTENVLLDELGVQRFSSALF
jgi:hypothetical protein